MKPPLFMFLPPSSFLSWNHPVTARQLHPCSSSPSFLQVLPVTFLPQQVPSYTSPFIVIYLQKSRCQPPSSNPTGFRLLSWFQNSPISAIPCRFSPIVSSYRFSFQPPAHTRTPPTINIKTQIFVIRHHLPAAGSLLLLFGCAGESDKGKRAMMTKIATDKSEIVVLTTDNPKTENQSNIFDDMLSGFGWTVEDYLRQCRNECCLCLPNGHRLFVHDLRRVALRAAIAMAEEGDLVVVAGRGHETYQLVGNKKVHIDDREECREALRDLNRLHQAGLGKCFPLMISRE